MSNEIDNLRSKGKRVAAEHVVFTGSVEALHRAQEEILAEVREILRPALPAVVSKIVGQTTRGVQVARGGLYLDSSGSWQIYENSFRMVPLTDAEVVDRGYSAEEIVQHLDAALSAQLTGRKAEVEERIAQQALRLRAVLTLLRK